MNGFESFGFIADSLLANWKRDSRHSDPELGQKLANSRTPFIAGMAGTGGKPVGKQTSRNPAPNRFGLQGNRVGLARRAGAGGLK